MDDDDDVVFSSIFGFMLVVILDFFGGIFVVKFSVEVDVFWGIFSVVLLDVDEMCGILLVSFFLILDDDLFLLGVEVDFFVNIIVDLVFFFGVFYGDLLDVFDLFFVFVLFGNGGVEGLGGYFSNGSGLFDFFDGFF